MSVPRQPFVGLTIAAAVGIICADFFPSPQSVLFPAALLMGIGALALLLWPRLFLIYLFVVTGFFLIHSFRQTESEGLNRLSGLLLTHGDSQHIGGAAPLLSAMKPTVLLDNPSPDRSIVHRRLRAVFKQRGLTPQLLSAGNEIRLSDEVVVKILYPPRGFSASTADEQSLVIQLVTSSARILLMSDSGEATERALMNSRADRRSDILVKGQNHSTPSGSDFFLDATRPRLIVATSRDFPDYERVSDEWADRVRARGIKLFRQDETGAVELLFRREDWQARSYITGEVFRSSSR